MCKNSNSFIDRLRTLHEMIYRETQKHKKLIEMQRNHPFVQFKSNSFADEQCTFPGPVILGRDVRLLNTKVGVNSYFAAGSIFNNCDVGSYCSIGPEVIAGPGNHPSSTFVSSHPSFYAPQNNSPVSYVQEQKIKETKRTLIGNDVWIGARSILIDGVNIGDGAIIAAGAVITKDVEPYGIVGGVPAKVLRKRFSDEEIRFLLDLRWWDKGEEWIRNNADSFDDIQKFMRKINSNAE